jgi:type IV secretory pathway VirB4 component
MPDTTSNQNTNPINLSQPSVAGHQPISAEHPINLLTVDSSTGSSSSSGDQHPINISAPGLQEHAVPPEAVLDLRGNITKTNTTPPSSPSPTLPQSLSHKQGFWEMLKAKWEEHVAKNKAKAAAAGQTVQPQTGTTPSGVLTEAEKKQIQEAQAIYEKGLVSIRDLIAPSAMEFTYSGFRVSGMFAKSYFVFNYPGFIETNWLSPIINFDVTMDISIFIYPIDNATIMKFLRNKVAQLRSSIAINAEKGNVRDPALEATLQDAEELRDALQRGTEKMFQTSLYFTVYSDDEKKLEKITKQLETMLGGKLVLIKPAFLQMEHAFNSCIPLAIDELGVVRNMNTGPLSTAFPFTSSDLTSNEGILYGLNRHNDSLIIFDRFKLENANSVIFAKSGAGKSYAIKLEILRSMMLGIDVIVIDPENEYESLATVVGGTYLRVSLNSEKRINPFDLPFEIKIKDEETKPGDLLRSNIINLQGLFNLMLGKLTPEEEALIDKALINVYALKGITIDTPDPGTLEPPTMEDFLHILQTMEGTESLTKRLEKFVTGTYSGIFNKPTNIDLKSGMVVFCIRDLEEQLRPIAMYVILNYIWNRVRSQLKKRILVIDEAWTMMQHEDSARFLYGLVKRARKYYLGISTITQDVEDFAHSPYGKPIISNSSLQLLLKQSPASIEALQKIFNLTEGEKYLLLNSGIGQGLFFAGNKHVAIQVIASYTEDKIITTNPEEILRKRESE